MPRRRPSDAPRAAASSSPVRRRSKTARPEQQHRDHDADRARGDGREHRIRGTGSERRSLERLGSPLENVTSPTAEKAKSPKPVPS